MSKTLLSLLFILTIASQASASREVLMRFWASEDYVRPLGLDGKPIVESYVYYPGEYYPSPFEEEDEAIEFETVARILIGELSKQNYVMNQDPVLADFILMVSWGQTSPESELEEVTYAGIESDDPDLIDAPVDDLVTYELPEHIRRQNAKLLGASKMDSMSRISLKKRLLEEAVLQDRYFINIYAISIDDIRNRDKTNKKGKKKKLAATWECQLSVTVDDRSSEDAFRAMAKSGSGYFGQDVRDLQFIDEGIKQGVVTIGEIRFLDSEEDADEEDADKAPKKTE